MYWYLQCINKYLKNTYSYYKSWLIQVIKTIYYLLVTCFYERGRKDYLHC